MRSSTLHLPYRDAALLRDSRLNLRSARIWRPHAIDTRITASMSATEAWHAGPVEEVYVIEFAFGHPLHIVDHPHARYSAQQIVQRARSRLGEQDFHLLSNNCEHFCNWCISGHHRSAQVERFRTVASLILRSKIAKWPDHVPEKGETDSGVRPSVYGAVTHQAAQTASRSFRTPRPQGGA